MKLINMTGTQLDYIISGLHTAFDRCVEDYEAKLADMRASGATYDELHEIREEYEAVRTAINSLIEDADDASWLWHYRNVPRAATVLDTIVGSDGKTSVQRNEARAAEITARLS